ncbi:MAG: sugar phosphate isomerase/epimerase [Ruminococcaceae bacterium]|nr:sugar phosphate isomerase/epimerase [Oscillospiraceae bacterium]
MKLAIENYVIRKHFGDFEALTLIKNAGFDCVDLSYYWTEENSPLLNDNYREYAKELRKHLDAIGLSCNQAHAPFDLKVGEAFELSTPAYRAIVRSMESAAILGAKTIVVHSLSAAVNERIVFDKEYNLEFYRSLLPYCEKFGIKVAVENLFHRDPKRVYYVGKLGTPEELCAFVRQLNSPFFVACVDIGHAALTGNEPEDFCAKMDGSLLQALHVQDGDYRRDAHNLPFLGTFKWEAIMKSLKNIGYQGELTFEVFLYLGNIPKELLPHALSFTYQTGKHLLDLFEEA